MIERKAFFDASRGTSMVPDKRADQGMADHAAYRQETREWALGLAKTDAGREAAEAEVSRYLAGHEGKLQAKLAADSRCLSSMVTGRSNFPSRRNEKANATADRRLSELVDYSERARRAIARKVKAADVEASGGELAVAREKLRKAEEFHDFKKRCNAAIRKYKAKGPEAQRAALLKVDPRMNEKTAERLLEAPYEGARQGFEGWELTNGLARIKAKRARIAELEKREQRTTTTAQVGDVEVVENAEEDRLQLVFPAKPSDEIRSDLKAEGFHWSRHHVAWQRQLTENARAAARRLFLQWGMVASDC